MSELNRLLQRLIAADIEFVIVGGFGAVVHGSSVVTRDLDVCAVLTARNVERLRDAFRAFNPTHRFSSPRSSFIEVPAAGVRLDYLYLQTDLGPLDVLGEIAGVGDYARVAASAVEVEVFGNNVRVIG